MPSPLLRPALLAALLAVPLMARPAAATDVLVRVLNMADAAGSMRVEICPAPEWLKGCTITGRGPAHAGLATVTVPNVPPGDYGVIAFHDSDDDGDVNQGFLGIPSEGVGFSRDAPARFSAPRFADAVVHISGPRTVVDIILHFERATR